MPAGGLFGVVAGLAVALPVVDAGGSAVFGGLDVVGVPDRGVAPGGAAGLVAQGDEVALALGEAAAAGVHGDEFAGDRGGEQPPQPDRGAAVEDEVAGPGGGDGAVAGDDGGFVAARVAGGGRAGCRWGGSG